MPAMIDFLGTLSATLLTLAIFSRIWRPNRAFRAAQYLLLGVLGGYVAAIVVRTVLWPQLVSPLLAGRVGALIPLFLIILLAMRFTSHPRLQDFGLLPLGLIVGVSGAVIVAGALRGTLVPQILAGADLSLLPTAPALLDTAAALVATVTTISVLFFFQVRSRPQWASGIGKALARWGYLTLMIGLGALLATTAGARITLLLDRLQFLVMIWQQWLGG